MENNNLENRLDKIEKMIDTVLSNQDHIIETLDILDDIDDRLYKLFDEETGELVLESKLVEIKNQITEELKSTLHRIVENLVEGKETQLTNISYSNSQESEITKSTSAKTEEKIKLLKEQEKKNTKEEWEKIIDEMAHSINNDVYLAVSKLARISDNEKVNSAKNHINKIRDLVNLTMLYLKRNEVPFSNEYSTININSVLLNEISGIEESLNTLRISSREHLKNLSEFKAIYTPIENGEISINKELESAIDLIFKDLIRNAYKNTDELEPKVSFLLESIDNAIRVTISNNTLISEEFLDWLNGNSEIEPEISKSMKVGLRVIKKWSDLLNLKILATRIADKNTTQVMITIPREIRYDQKS